MLNHIVLMGRLTRDPEIRQTQSGVDVTTFSLAVDRDFREVDGTRETDFINCVAWRHTAVFVHQYFSKGSMAAVSGRLQMREWQDSNGNRRVSAEVVAENVYFAGAKSSSDGGQGDRTRSPSEPRPAPQSRADAISPQFADLDGDDGDLPF